MVKVIRLGGKKSIPLLSPGEQLIRFKGKTEGLPGIIKTPLRIIASPKTTVALASGLGALLGFRGAGAKGILKGVAKGFGFGTIGVTAPSVIQTFPEASKLFFDPTKRIGEIEELPEAPGKIAGFFTDKFVDVKETVKDIPPIVLGGLGGLAGGAIAVPIVKTIIETVKGRKEKEIIIPETIIPSTQFSQLPTVVQPQQQPIGAVQQEVVEEKPKAIQTVATPNIINKNVFNPEINISFKKSRKFINQQILV